MAISFRLTGVCSYHVVSPVCREDTKTLVDIAYNLLHELADVHHDDEVGDVLRSMLKHITRWMSDRASVMRSFNKAFSEQRRDTLAAADNDMEFVHCNTHFLFGTSAASEKVLKQWEKEHGKKFGWDHTTCDILGSRGDEKSGCKDS